MREVLKKVSFQEYNLTMLRILIFLDYVNNQHKKIKTNVDRIMLYDFYLKFPGIFQISQLNEDFDTKYSYFHWVPNRNLYSAVIANLCARGLIEKNDTEQFFISQLGIELVEKLNLKYFMDIKKYSEIVIEKKVKLTDKAIKEEINNLVNQTKESSYEDLY